MADCLRPTQTSRKGGDEGRNKRKDESGADERVLRKGWVGDRSAGSAKYGSGVVGAPTSHPVPNIRRTAIPPQVCTLAVRKTMNNLKSNVMHISKRGTEEPFQTKSSSHRTNNQHTAQDQVKLDNNKENENPITRREGKRKGPILLSVDPPHTQTSLFASSAIAWACRPLG